MNTFQPFRSRPIPTRLEDTPFARRCSPLSTSSRSTARNVLVFFWNILNGYNKEPSSPNLAPLPTLNLFLGRIGSSKVRSLRSAIILVVQLSLTWNMQIVLGVFLLLPESSKKSVYYVGLITELCKLSPSTVGPAVGKSIRKLYTGLSDGLDVEVSRRFAEWFATHMSNFGFQWVWKEWYVKFLTTGFYDTDSSLSLGFQILA